MNSVLQKKALSSLPHQPGVYIFKDADGSILYVGKANDLHSRVSQYFRPDADNRPQIPFLISDAVSLEHIITDSEAESLILENNLIKRFRPKYNIKLKDDKNYLFIKIDYESEIPQIYTVRNPDSTGKAKYFGPYTSGQKVRETLRIIRYIFSYCANTKISNRPCFYYHLHRCPGVCIGQISLEEYRLNYLHRIELFLAGNIFEVKKDLQKQMRSAAAEKNFEAAAQARDKVRSIEVIEERQKVMFAKKVDWDFISFFQAYEQTAVNIFSIRNGKLMDKNNFILEGTKEASEREIVKASIENYYLPGADIKNALKTGTSSSLGQTLINRPKEIFVQEIPEDLAILKTTVGVAIDKPLRGKNNQLIKLGAKNAQEFYEQWISEKATELSRTNLALGELAAILHLPEQPQRLECFDISNTQGTNAVASMVVFENAKPKKSEYRKFKMQISGEPNDFAMMREALTRRFRPPENPLDAPRWNYPDLLVVDGGKGQLSVAVEVLNMYHLDNIAVIGLAKREEEIFVPDKEDPILLPKSNYALQLLQRLRDEAHRFGITFHRSLRSKAAYKSALDEIPGIGPAKKKLLLKKFGSVSKIKSAPIEELQNLVGASLSKVIKSNL